MAYPVTVPTTPLSSSLASLTGASFTTQFNQMMQSHFLNYYASVHYTIYIYTSLHIPQHYDFKSFEWKVIFLTYTFAIMCVRVAVCPNVDYPSKYLFLVSLS